MHFITNGYKRFSKTNSTDPGQRVPLKNLIKLEVRPKLCFENLIQDISLPLYSINRQKRSCNSKIPNTKSFASR